jgi:hypothetical protein
MCCKNSWKPFCESLFRCSVAFLIMSVATQKRCTLSVDFIWANRKKSGGTTSVEYGGCSNVLTLLFDKKSLTKIGQCAGALSWRRKELLVLNLSGHFLLTSSVGRRRISVCISLFTLAIPINDTSEFRGPFEIYIYIRLAFCLDVRQRVVVTLCVAPLLQGQW